MDHLTITPKLGRNDPCHCGSGKKYKQCHLDADEKAAREARARAAAEAAPDASATDASDPDRARRHEKPGFHDTRGRGGANTRGFQRASSVRKVGGGG